MTKLLTLTALLALAALAAADCPNACSGHGDCNSNYDFCECFHGFIGADCSQRLCQFGLSWIDTPQGDLNHDNTLSGGFGDDTVTRASGERPAGTPDTSALNPMWRFQGWWERHPAALYGTNNQFLTGALPFYVRPQEGHFYAECSNRGVCNRATGLCDCLTGYEGAACNRTVCQSDCSGHGTCQTVREVTPSHLHYRLWDMDKTRICECDGGYFGIDCSQRNCMKNDDPLTTTATREDYNDGLLEANEVQVVEVRCPFAGLMLDPSISLTYTDVQFGDEYETARFDPTDMSADVMGALKALPNQVLADYVVDEMTVVEKVISASMTTYEAGNHVAWTITFDEHLGDVPLLSGTAYFKCQGGAEVSTAQSDGSYNIENVNVAFIGDGPATFLEIDGDFSDGLGAAGVDQLVYTVNDATGTPLASGTDTYDAGDGAFATTNAFSRELSKVSLDFGAADDVGGRGHLNIKIHVDPVVSARNIQFALAPGADRSIALTTGPGALTLDLVESETPTYDQAHVLTIVSSTSAGPLASALWQINGETIGFVDLTSAAAALSASLTGFAAPAAFHTTSVGGVELDGNDFIATAALGGAVTSDGDHVDDTFVFGSAKRSHPTSFYQSVTLHADGNPIEEIHLTFADNIAPSLAINLVFEITETSSDPDLYRWKVAGDTDWVVPVDGTGTPTGASGFPMSDTNATIGDSTTLTWYLENRYPDDPMRAGLTSVQVGFSGGSDLDSRICGTQSTNSRDGKYYAQIGTSGVNDSPVCSDRGICDYTSGLCQCYRGYAGIDCSEQNALAQGFSGSTSAF